MKSLYPSIIRPRQVLPAMAAMILFAARIASATDYPTTILADNPLVYYRLEETSGPTAVDSSASGAFPGVYNASAAYPLFGQPGIDTNSISISQTASVTAGYYPELNQQAPFSFEIWARPVSTSTTDYRCPIGNFSGWNTATQSGWYVYQTPGGSASRFDLVLQPADIEISQAFTPLSWYHLVGTYDGTNVSFYINGVLVGSANAAGYVANDVNNAAGGAIFALGGRGDNGVPAFDGGLDEFAYYTNALTAAQILNHYQVGTNSFRLAALPPSILTDAISTNAYAGHTATFSVIADGANPLAYQWYKGSSPLSGATNSALAFTCVPTDDGTTYCVVVTNFVGSITSSVVTLSVSTGLQIDAPLTSITRNVGSMAAFEIVAEGALPLSYQWNYGDGTPISGATNSVLWLSNVQLTNDSTTYYVTITNPYTAINSDQAALYVQARPVTVPLTGYAKVVAADSPVAFWQMDEPDGSSTAVDTVGSFDGTYIAGSGTLTFGAPSGIPHDTNSSLGVTGGATVSVPFAIEINPPTGGFTWEGWFNPASLAANGNDYRTVFCSMSNPYGAGNTGWLVYQTSDNHWAWWPRNGFYLGASVTDPDLIVANQWYYLTLVYDGTNFMLYVNGALKDSEVDPGFVQNGNVPDTANGPVTYNYNYNTAAGLPIGSGATVFGWRSPVDFQPFSGDMDNIAVYNKALTVAQIQNHFLNTTHLSAVTSGSQIVITWPVGTLQSSTNVAGPYADVDGAVSPYTNVMTGAQLYYRAKIQ